MGSEQKTGRACKLYRNTGTWDSPSWSEITCLADVTLDTPRGETDGSSRETAFNLTLQTLINVTVNAELKHAPSDASFAAIRTAYQNGTSVELAVLDGDITTPGSQGLRANFGVFNWARNEPLEGELTYTMTFKPVPSANNPAWYTVSS